MTAALQQDQIFQYASMLAMIGWAALLASPLMPVLADRLAGTVIPALLSIAYAGLVLAFFFRAEGGFDTLDNIAKLFDTRAMLLAGWIHYLAFDLFVGAWATRVARREGIAFPLMVPILASTFLLGPAGFLAFKTLRFIRNRQRAALPPAFQGD